MSGTAGVRFSSKRRNQQTKIQGASGEIRRRKSHRDAAGIIEKCEKCEKGTEKVKAVILVML
jgi:hypothetical protein